MQDYPAGHFYSALPDLELIERRYESLVATDRPACTGVDLRVDEQHALLAELARYHDEQPFTHLDEGKNRYYAHNEFFPGADAIFLYALLRHLRPRRVIEVGSGFSSAVMLDTDELFLGRRTSFTFIEPHPERLRQLLRGADEARHRILPVPVQDVPVADFEALAADDVLFVDSSHVAKFGSDVTHLLFEVVPRLRQGVVLHFHDIHWPFEYPKQWLLGGRIWNEAYLLRAMLTGSRDLHLLCFVDWLRRFARDRLAATLPLALGYPGASLWARKVGP